MTWHDVAISRSHNKKEIKPKMALSKSPVPNFQFTNINRLSYHYECRSRSGILIKDGRARNVASQF